ncbi:hypothetical protein Hdeb2414_s0314g00865021 [Helianthus debilis subsp. tardiflorus]
MLYKPLKHNIIYNPNYNLCSKKKKKKYGVHKSILGFLILITFYPPPSPCFLSRRFKGFKRRSRVSLGQPSQISKAKMNFTVFQSALNLLGGLSNFKSPKHFQI